MSNDPDAPNGPLPPVRKRTRVVPPSQPAPQPDKLDYEVGYKKPPKHTQFKPGVSGNLPGRPRGAKSFNTIVRENMQRSTRVRTSDGEKKFSRIEAIFLKVGDLASKGNLRAAERLIAWYAQAVPEAPKDAPPTLPDGEHSATDQATLEAYQKKVEADLLVSQAAPDGDDDDAENGGVK